MHVNKFCILVIFIYSLGLENFPLFWNFSWSILGKPKKSLWIPIMKCHPSIKCSDIQKKAFTLYLKAVTGNLFGDKKNILINFLKLLLKDLRVAVCPPCFKRMITTVLTNLDVLLL